MIRLTERTITQTWNKETQQHEQVVTDSVVYVNPDAIEAFREMGDAPEKYATHVRMRSGWDLFVVEEPWMIAEQLRRRRSHDATS
jgi:hypothetical protein